MEKKPNKRRRRTICIYIAALLLLYVVIEVLPKVTDVFETTQVLEPGNLKISCETTGYFVKDESIGIASKSGKIKYKVSEGTAVRKGYKVASIKESYSDEVPGFDVYTQKLKGYEGLSEGNKAPISGLFSLTIDGNEEYFAIDNLDSIKRDKVGSMSFEMADLDRDTVIEGEPIYKITMDDYWYVLCWVDEDNAENYHEGQDVTLELPEGSVDASIYSINEDKDDDDYRVVIYSDVYYEALCESRVVDVSIVTSDTEGLIVDNGCIIEKDGNKGVYVKNKNGEYVFKRVNVISSNDKQSVLSDSTYYDEDGKQVMTVNVYDEVLRKPESALEDDLKKESEKGETEESADDEGSEEEDSNDSND